MNIQDPVYGDINIFEPVLIEIINNPMMQRLKHISQIGYPKPFFRGGTHSRFEHSVGVCTLLKKYNASVEEQVAGLIHDISHSAFSHCIDYALDVGSQKEQTHQDNVFAEFVRKMEIPLILGKYNIDIEYILNDNNFSLKEKNLPYLCADRVDYSLRDAHSFGLSVDSKYFLDHLIVREGDWLFTDYNSAAKFAELFLTLNANYYAAEPSAIMLSTVGDYLRYALKEGYISEDDLYLTDREVLSLLQPYHNEDTHFRVLFGRMNGDIACVNDPDDYEKKVFLKSRIVNPLCLQDGEIRQLSDIDSTWIPILEKESQPKQFFLRFAE